MYIDNQQITKVLSMQKCIQVMHELFLMDFEAEIINPLRGKMFLPAPSKGILGMMPAYIKPYNLMGAKVLSVFPDNYKKGLSSHQGILHLFEIDTGKLLVSMNADEITAIRTAAVSAVATQLLAKKDAKKLCIIGSGKQAIKHLEAMLLIRPIESVSIWSKNKANAIRFVEMANQKYRLSIQVSNSVDEAVTGADIICTTTASKTPVLSARNVENDAHINAIGSCSPSSRELTTDLIETSDVYVDDNLAAINEAGDILIPSIEKACGANHFIKADLSKITRKEIAVIKENRTIFKSVGLGAEDVAAGFFCYNQKEDFFCNK